MVYICPEDIDYKTRYEIRTFVVFTQRKKKEDIKELEEKCLSFENEELSLEQENDSLRLALTIIVQEKNERDIRHRRQMIAGPLWKTPCGEKYKQQLSTTEPEFYLQLTDTIFSLKALYAGFWKLLG